MRKPHAQSTPCSQALRFVTQSTQVKRLLKGAVTYVPPPDDDLTYEYDAAKPTSKAIYCCRAPLDGKACVR